MTTNLGTLGGYSHSICCCCAAIIGIDQTAYFVERLAPHYQGELIDIDTAVIFDMPLHPC